MKMVRDFLSHRLERARTHHRWGVTGVLIGGLLAVFLIHVVPSTAQDSQPAELPGIHVTESFEILMIHDDGLIAKHNSECHPDKIVIPGDHMTVVNGQHVNTLSQFRKIIQQGSVMEATFVTF